MRARATSLARTAHRQTTRGIISIRRATATAHARASHAMAMRFIDVGANMMDDMFRGVYRGKRAHDDDTGAVLARARAVGVEKIIVTCGTLDEARSGVEMVRESRMMSASIGPELYATVGVHPTRAYAFRDDPDGADAHVAKLLRVAEDSTRDGAIVAIGECGLDYDRLEFCDAETQREAFARHFELARAVGLPMFLHMRGGGEHVVIDDFVDILSANAEGLPMCVVHSFDGSLSDAERVLAVAPGRVFIGVNGCSLRSEANIDVIRAIPLDVMVLETDAPWCGIKRTHAGYVHLDLPPEHFPLAVKKDKHVPGETLVRDRNEPAHALAVAQIIAGIKGIDVNVVADVTYRNAQRVFFAQKRIE
jgi:TatD DNase family protein